MLPVAFHTTRLLLRPIGPDDAGPIFDSYAGDPEVTRYLTWRPHRSRHDTEAYVKQSMAISPEIARTYVLMDLGTDTLIGALDLRHTRTHRLEFGYVLARARWGQGLMTEALVAAATWTLKQPSLFRIGSVCDIDNTASARVMQKAGLTCEGLLRRWIVHPNIGDEPRDCLSYAQVR